MIHSRNYYVFIHVIIVINHIYGLSPNMIHVTQDTIIVITLL